MAPSNKDRIYVALYARGGQDPDSYHWALIIGPKNEVEGGRGLRCHVRQRLDPGRPGQFLWHYESLEIPLEQTAMLLARITIGKVLNKNQLIATLAAVPLEQHNAAWTCRIWVRDAIVALEADGRSLGTRMTDWQKIEETARTYVGQKRQLRRYDGSGSWKRGTVPTYDMLEEKEVIP